MIMNENEFLTKYYDSLIGATILDFKLVKDPEDPYLQWPTFKIRLADGDVIKVEVSMDEEGNGAGFLFGLPRPVTNRVPDVVV